MKKPAPVRKRKPLSAAQLEQRRAASRAARGKQTGPKTDEGKARSSRNAWKHGLTSKIHRAHFDNGIAPLLGAMGKPCRTTCPKYPCSLVDDGEVKPGDTCMDKTTYVQAFTALIDAVQNKSMEGIHGMMAAEIASTLQMLHDLKGQVTELGPMIGIPMIDNDGKVITRADGSEVIGKWVPNPGWPVVLKTLEVLGISLPEMLATPQSQAKAKTAEETTDAMQQALGGIFQRAQAGQRMTGPGRVIEGEVVK